MENKEPIVMDEEVKQEMVVHEANAISLADANFCSIKADTPEAKANLFNALINPDERISDHFNKVINVVDVLVEVVPMINKETGEYRECPRVVFFDENGKTYQAVSFGVYNALKRLFMIYGEPHWDIPIPIMPKQITNKDRKITTLVISAK